MQYASFAIILSLAAPALAQSPEELMKEPAVRAAMEAARADGPHTLDLQVHVCEIPAPPFHEDQRGLELKRLFEDLHLHDVRIDKAGNVIGVRPGKSAHPNLVLPPMSPRCTLGADLHPEIR